MMILFWLSTPQWFPIFLGVNARAWRWLKSCISYSHPTAALASVLLFLKFIELTLCQDTSLPSQNALAPDICMICSFTSFWSQLKYPLMHEALLYYLQRNSKLPTPQHCLLPLSCLMFLHSTYHLLTYCFSLVYLLFFSIFPTTTFRI